jgi:hypothetical protein
MTDHIHINLSCLDFLGFGLDGGLVEFLDHVDAFIHGLFDVALQAFAEIFEEG